MEITLISDSHIHYYAWNMFRFLNTSPVQLYVISILVEIQCRSNTLQEIHVCRNSLNRDC